MSYEFSEEENIQFLTFMKRSIILSIGLIITGVLLTVEGAIPGVQIGDIYTGLLFMIAGMALFVPIQSFLNIIITTGKDMEELLKGFSSFSSGMRVISLALGVNLLFIIIGIIAKLVSG